MARNKNSYNELFNKKVSTELFSLTYGAFVAQLVFDIEDNDEINKNLDNIGYKIGLRISDDFMSKTQQVKCCDLREMAEILAKFAFKAYFGTIPHVDNLDSAKNSFSFIFDQNPLSEFVELPPENSALWFSNLLCGIIRGALEVVHLEVVVKFIQDVLHGDEKTEIQLTFIQKIVDTVPPGED